MAKDPTKTPETAGEALDRVIAKTKAKADKKKAPKPTKIDAMKARRPPPAADGSVPLKDKMERFCQYYIGEAKLNATQAARLAGYSQKTAQRIGSENLSKLLISARLSFLQRATMQKLEITPEMIMDQVAKIAFGSLRHFIKVQADGTGYIDLKDVTGDQLDGLDQYEVMEMPPFKTVENGEEVVREVLKIRVKLGNRNDALEKLMRRHNLIKPIEVNLNHTGKVKMDNTELARRVAFMLAKAAKASENKPKGVPHAADNPPGDVHG